MMPTIERTLAQITEDRRATYLFHTKTAADAVGCHPNKFNDWWQRSRSKLIELYKAQPGEFAAELAAMIAQGEAERQRERTNAPMRTAGRIAMNERIIEVIARHRATHEFIALRITSPPGGATAPQFVSPSEVERNLLAPGYAVLHMREIRPGDSTHPPKTIDPFLGG